MFLLVLLVAILSVPVLFIKNNNPDFSWYFNVIAFFGLSTLIFFISYWLTYKKIHGGGFKNFISFIAMFFTFFSVAMGFSVHNSVAVIEGHLGKKSEFVRTPKFNINSIKDSWKGNKYLSQNVSGNTIIALVLMLYFGYAIYSAFTTGDFGLIIFHLMLFAGFGFVGLKSLFAKG